MTRIAYVDGRYLPIGAPAVRVEDRGLQFADGVYEVIKCLGGRPCDLERHLDRLERSLAALAIPMPVSRRALDAIIAQTLRRNRLRDALVYLQVDRGVAPRNHLFPADAHADPDRHRPPRPLSQAQGTGRGGRRCHLAGPALEALRRQVREPAGQRPGPPAGGDAGCREVWLYDADGCVTEGAGSNAYLVDGDGRLVTRPLGPEILGGVTREVVLELARADGIAVIERPFTVAEAYAAREAFLTSTSSLVLPVTTIDGRAVANGMPGSVTRRLLERYRDHLMKAG